MTDTIKLGELTVLMTRKAVKNVHLSVHPPEGRVTLTAPIATRLDVARAYVICKRAALTGRQCAPDPVLWPDAIKRQ